jgi:ubiquinone/menaquinone biosynthesis C-methylase UbiE
LDVGCAWGYATRFFATRANRVAGIDPDADAIAVARYRYPDINFIQGILEELPYADESFDVVTCCDTFEHVADERASLDEMWRVLRPGGVLILSTPHRGLFAWLDHANYIVAMRETFARRLPRVFAAVQRARNRPVLSLEEYSWVRHRHYTMRDFERLFQSSSMAGRYTIDSVRRSGLLIFPLALNIAFFASRLPTSIRERALAPIRWMSEREYWISFGALAYNVGLRIVKSD